MFSGQLRHRCTCTGGISRFTGNLAAGRGCSPPDPHHDQRLKSIFREARRHEQVIRFAKHIRSRSGDGFEQHHITCQQGRYSTSEHLPPENSGHDGSCTQRCVLYHCFHFSVRTIFICQPGFCVCGIIIPQPMHFFSSASASRPGSFPFLLT